MITRNQKMKADVLDVDENVSVFNEGLQVKSVELGNQDVPLPTLTRLSQKKSSLQDSVMTDQWSER